MSSLTGMPMQSFDSVTIDTDLDTVCSEQVRQHLKSALSNRTGTGTILTYVFQKSRVLFVCWMHVQFYWCYNAFLFCMYVTVTHFAEYADRVNSDQEYNPKYGMLSYFTFLVSYNLVFLFEFTLIHILHSETALFWCAVMQSINQSI